MKAPDPAQLRQVAIDTHIAICQDPSASPTARAAAAKALVEIANAMDGGTGGAPVDDDNLSVAEIQEGAAKS